MNTEHSIPGDALLVLVSLAFTVFLLLKKDKISPEFQSSWNSIYLGVLCGCLGLSLNLSRDFPGLESIPFLGPTGLNYIAKTSLYLICMALVFNGVRQWYPLVLSVQQEAARSGRFYQSLIQEANSIFLRWDRSGNIISINRFGEELFGYSEAELRGQPVVGTLVEEKDHSGRDLRAMIDEIKNDPDSYKYNENENITRDGRKLWVAWRNAYIDLGDGGEPQLLSIGVDITERKRIEDALYALASSINYGGDNSSQLEETLHHLAWAYGVEKALYGVYADERRDSIRVLALWDGKRILKDMVYSLEGTPCQDVLDGKVDLIASDVQKLYPDDEELKRWGAESYFGMPLIGGDGRPVGIIAVLDGRPMRISSWTRPLLRVFASRISGELERKRIEENVYQLAHYDSLTGLPNRLLFHDRLEQTLAQAARNDDHVALLFLDLDRFKHVNDTVGHAGGDLLLKQAAQRLLSCTRKTDTLARMGGDEFIISLASFKTEEALLRVSANLAHRIVEQMSEPFYLDGIAFHVSVSIGITLYPTDGRNIDYLIRNADIAMYHAKDNGRNGFEFYHERMNELTEKRNRMESDLHAALSNGEFLLHYQPIVNVRAHRVNSFEALLRWQHPVNGLVMPDAFISLAEDCGLIIPIGEWVLEEVCRQLAQWREQGVGIDHVSVNLSMRQLERPGLVETLQKCTQKYKIAPGQLTLEITESMLMENPGRTLPMLKSLEEMGYAIAMDDFGTGYSSFGQLLQLSVSWLKIDRSFVAHMQEDKRGSDIIAAVIGMGNGLGMSVVAEGVETADQRHCLLTQGCTLMQGYYFGRPMNARDCEKYVQAG